VKVFVSPGGHWLWSGTVVDLLIDYAGYGGHGNIDLQILGVQSSCKEEQRDE